MSRGGGFLFGSKIYSEATVAALRLAATWRATGDPLSTGLVFAALPRVDIVTEWERLWLHTGDPESLTLRAALDSPSGACGKTWEGVPLTRSLADSLALLDRMCDAYKLRPARPEILALALVADSQTGAARYLTRSGSTHEELLACVQDDLIGADLDGFRDLISASPQVPPPVPVHQGLGTIQPPPMPGPPASTPAWPPSTAHAWPPASAPSTPKRKVTFVGARIGWRALGALAIAAILGALATSPSNHVSPTPALTPPFALSPLTGPVLTTADVRGAFGVETVQVVDQLPDGRLWTTTSPMGADLRNQVVVSGWARGWVSADQRQRFFVQIVRVTRDQYLSGVAETCSPTTPVPVTGAGVAGFTYLGPGGADACLTAEANHRSIHIETSVLGDRAAERAFKIMKSLEARQISLTEADRTTAPTVRPSHYAQASINRVLMNGALLLPLTIALTLAAVDRAMWRRLRRKLSRRSRPDPFTVSLSALDRLELARTAALALVRSATYLWVLRLSEAIPLGLHQTMAALFVTFLALAAIESRLARRNRFRWHLQPFRGAARALAAVGLGLTALIVAGAALVAEMSLSFGALGLNPFGPDYLIGRGASLGAFAAAGVLTLALIPFTFVRRLAMRRIRSESQQRPGQHVVLLRSFADDRRKLRAHLLSRASIVERLCMRRWERFEEVIAYALNTVGPVIALSHPGERLPPPLGAVRQQYHNEVWQEGVRELIGTAALVCVVVGRTESLVAEIEQVKWSGALGKTVFFIPPSSRGEQRRRLALLSARTGIPWARLGEAQCREDILAVAVPGHPQRALIVSSIAPDDVSYSAAVHVCATVLGRAQAPDEKIHRLLTEVEAAQALVPPTYAPPAISPPPVTVYPRGKAPVYRPFYRRPILLPWVLFAIVSGLVPLLTTVVSGVSSSLPKIPMPGHVPGLLAEDATTGTLYAAVDGTSILRVDLKGKRASGVYSSSNPISRLIVRDGIAYACSRLRGEVFAVDLGAGKLLWTYHVQPETRGLVLDGPRLSIVVPAQHKVLTLAAHDGRVERQQEVPGIPWDIEVAGRSLVVSLIDKDQLLFLDAGSLKVVATRPTIASPQDVVVVQSTPWVVSRTAYRIRRSPLDGTAGPDIWLSDLSAETAANANLLAIRGHERVSLLHGTSVFRRLPLPCTNLNGILVDSQGRVLVSCDDTIAQIG